MTHKPLRSSGTGDRYLWLEEIAGERADQWVRQANARTEALLVDDQCEADRRAALAILDNDARIPWISRRGPLVYNLWNDADNPRGLWRRTTLASYESDAPVWETVLDIDELARSEGKPWKFGGAAGRFGGSSKLAPDYRRALVRLSPGGSDAVEIREFDLVEKRFIDGGFFLPQAKCWAVWEDADTLLVGHADGEAHTTTSGYARTVRRLQRGQVMADAEVVMSIDATDLGTGVYIDCNAAYPATVYVHHIDFYRQRAFVELPGGPRRLLEIPETARGATCGDRLAIRPREDWSVAGRVIPAGALAVTSLQRYLDGARDLEVVFEPGPRKALASFTMTPSAILLNVNENITGRIEVVRRDPAGGWSRATLPGTPAMASLGEGTLDSGDGPVTDDVMINATTFTEPVSMALWSGTGAPRIIKRGPAAFDASGVSVEQREAVAADGEHIPYFVVGRRDAMAGGLRPAVLYGYGGFEVNQGPSYLALAGKLWIERGGLYIIANIRGGGEFGPQWHEAGKREKKHVSHDDFAAVARDLTGRGLTSADKLACMGGSNGGLLVGNMITRYPELFGAVICTVPLLDMARYTKLLAGASWIAEYGDPDDDAEWAFIERFSAYHQLRTGVCYPRVLFITSRNDDRVHPGHARKMAAAMQAMGLDDVLFWENVEGGHGGAADNAQTAHRTALCYSFLRRTIGAGMPTA